MTVEVHQGWLVCDLHNVAPNPELDKKWCNHILEFTKNGRDAEGIKPGQQIVVPVVPTQGVFVEVQIVPLDYLPGKGLIRMLFTPDIGRAISVDLGFWNPGEGRHSISRVILDFIKSKVDSAEDFKSTRITTKCPNGAHGIRQQSELLGNQDIGWKWKCLWNIVMEKACSVCIEEAAGTPDNNGLDDLDGSTGSFSGRFGNA